jgi:hypothetical protein
VAVIRAYFYVPYKAFLLLYRYKLLGEKGFTSFETSSKMLASVYGRESKIYELKSDVNRIRLNRHGIVQPKERVKLPDSRSSKQIQSDKYWHNAQALLINVRNKNLCICAVSQQAQSAD